MLHAHAHKHKWLILGTHNIDALKRGFLNEYAFIPFTIYHLYDHILIPIWK